MKQQATINARVNVPRIVDGMRARGWGIAATCANAGVNNKTLTKILKGEIPKRLDAFFRVLNALRIPTGEAVDAHQKAKLHVVPSGRRQTDIA